MFGKKKEVKVEEVKTEKYKCPFETGDEITVPYADLTDFPISDGACDDLRDAINFL